jgi:carbonic anhydrase
MLTVCKDLVLFECVRCVVWGDEVPHHWGEVREANQCIADGKNEWHFTSTPDVT